MGIVTRLETITPAKARRWLDNRASNRPLSERWATRLAGAIKSGEWKTNGETIKFDEDGRLQDGQHRLQAVIVADKSIETFVTRGIPADSFDTIDIGRKRTISDVLARAGEAHYTKIAGGISWLFRWERGTISIGAHESPRIAEAVALLERNPGIRDSAPIGQQAHSVLPPSVGTFLHYIFSKISREQAAFFFERLISGEELSSTNPLTSAIYALRKRLLDNNNAKAKLPMQDVIAIAIKAWNAFRGRKVVRCIVWRSAGDTAEDFPFPV